MALCLILWYILDTGRLGRGPVAGHGPVQQCQRFRERLMPGRILLFTSNNLQHYMAVLSLYINSWAITYKYDYTV